MINGNKEDNIFPSSLQQTTGNTETTCRRLQQPSPKQPEQSAIITSAQQCRHQPLTAQTTGHPWRTTCRIQFAGVLAAAGRGRAGCGHVFRTLRQRPQRIGNMVCPTNPTNPTKIEIIPKLILKLTTYPYKSRQAIKTVTGDKELD